MARTTQGRSRRKARPSRRQPKLKFEPDTTPSVLMPNRSHVDRIFGVGSDDPTNLLSESELDEEYYRALLSDKDWFGG